MQSRSARSLHNVQVADAGTQTVREMPRLCARRAEEGPERNLSQPSRASVVEIEAPRARLDILRYLANLLPPTSRARHEIAHARLDALRGTGSPVDCFEDQRIFEGQDLSS